MDALIGVLPVMMVGGLAMKMSERMFPAQNSCATPGRKIRSKGRGRGLARGKGRGPIGRPRAGMGFGNFSSLPF